jgi:hypothetical protein
MNKPVGNADISLDAISKIDRNLLGNVPIHQITFTELGRRNTSEMPCSIVLRAVNFRRNTVPGRNFEILWRRQIPNPGMLLSFKLCFLVWAGLVYGRRVCISMNKPSKTKDSPRILEIVDIASILSSHWSAEARLRRNRQTDQRPKSFASESVRVKTLAL